MVVMECQADGREIESVVKRSGAGRLVQVKQDPDRSRPGWSRSLSALRAGGHAWRLVPYVPQGRKTDLVYFSYEA